LTEPTEPTGPEAPDPPPPVGHTGAPGARFADAHRVALDVATGICVETRELGGPTPGRGLDVVIEQVAQPMPDEWFTSPRRQKFRSNRGLLERIPLGPARPGLAPTEGDGPGR
jgi:hypothetical protein